MTGLEQQYLRACIKALVRAREGLLSLDCQEAIQSADYGKPDTLLLDAVPEAALVRYLCESFDPHLPLVTEETGDDVVFRGTEEEVVCFSDPMDRSKVLGQFLSNRSGSIRDLLARQEFRHEWESECGGAIELTGAYGSITATRHHHILFNVMLNYLTGHVYVTCDTAAGSIPIEAAFDDEELDRLKRTRNLISALSPVQFSEAADWREGRGLRFTAYCKGAKYEDNLVASRVALSATMERIRADRLVFDEPGGPARILYLTKSDVGFILANGEKVGEWIGWLAWVAHSNGRLKAFEITFDSSWTRDTVLMAPGKAYAILGDDVERVMGRQVKLAKLNLQKLRFLDNPSEYRSTLLVCPSSNHEIQSTLIDDRCTELRFD